MNKPLRAGIGLLLLVLLLGRLTDCTEQVGVYLSLLGMPALTTPLSRERLSASQSAPATPIAQQPTAAATAASSSLQPHLTTQPTAENPTREPLAIYTVKKGDRLWRLALRFYGDGSLWHRIAEANHIAHPFHIYEGSVLVIPDKDD
jgi:5'-nucleotidase / UDP-sugar diphosphatase